MVTGAGKKMGIAQTKDKEENDEKKEWTDANTSHEDDIEDSWKGN